MRVAAVLRMGLLGAGLCVTACEGATEAPPATEAAPVAAAEQEASHSTSPAPEVPKSVFKKSIEKARKTITAGNARQRLAQLDTQIEREREITR